jgi:uncharacterized protein involved in type VI secretion and phage assembly
MSKVYGVVSGKVTDVKDPDGMGRVRVRYPWLGGESDGYWAPVATLMAGGNRGSWFMPEVDDDVLVAFDQGDVTHPYIVGFMWNGKDKPPSSDIDTQVRRLKTVSGHTLDFDDRSGKEKIRIKTQGGHQIEMTDAPTPSVTIKTSGGHDIEMKDTPTPTVSVKTSGGQQISLSDLPPSVSVQTTAGQQVILSDAPPSITVSAPAGMLNITCLQATITASALLNVLAPIAQFAGVVQASAIVAAAYTPAPGNTFGL